MSKLKPAAINPETEITRTGIRVLSGISQSKVDFIISRERFNFPKVAREGPHKLLIYNLAEVKAWLHINSMQAIVVGNKDRRPADRLASPLALFGIVPHTLWQSPNPAGQL